MKRLKPTNPMDYGLKLLAADGGSINSKHERVIYPMNELITVPGNGAYIAVTSGLNSGGSGPVLASFECDEPTGAPAPSGVVCYRKVRRIANAPIKTFSGSLDLRGCDLKGVKLPESVGGWLDLRGCDLKGVKLPESVGGSLDLRGCDLKGVKLPESVGRWLDLRGCDLKGVKLPESVGGWLDLSDCDLKGVKLPEKFAHRVIK